MTEAPWLITIGRNGGSVQEDGRLGVLRVTLYDERKLRRSVRAKTAYEFEMSEEPYSWVEGTLAADERAMRSEATTGGV